MKERRVQGEAESELQSIRSPRAYTDPHERPVNTCEDLEDLANYQHQKYHKLKLVRICLGKDINNLFVIVKVYFPKGQEGLI